MSQLKKADIYKRPASDAVQLEGTVMGAVISLFAVGALCTLLFFQCRSFLAVNVNHSIVVDHTDDAEFQINFKVTLPELSCEWASVDALDAIGHRRFNLTSDSIIKRPTGSRVVTVERAAKTAMMQRKVNVPVYDNTTDKDHYGNRKVSIELNQENFHDMIANHKAMLVDFHAPWCPHCVRFAPVWEDAADRVQKRVLEGATRYPWSIALGSVDCTQEGNDKICQEQHIQAFPTVRVYRRGTDLEGPDGHQHHESYNGQRTAEAVSEFAYKVLSEVESDAGPRLTEQGVYTTSADTFGFVAPGTDSTGDGKPDSKILSRGCVVEGNIKVSTVPGVLMIIPHSEGHTFNVRNVNVTHEVNHLSFGKFVPGALAQKVSWNSLKNRGSMSEKAFRQIVKRLPADMGGRFANVATPDKDAAAGGKKDKKAPEMPAGAPPGFFLSKQPHTAHEHYVKVVPTRYEALDVGAPVQLYEYSINSNAFVLHEKAGEEEGKEHHGPGVKINYDISPMQVVMKEQRKDALDWVLGVCAILGGVYTCIMIVESFLQGGVKVVKKSLKQL